MTGGFDERPFGSVIEIISGGTPKTNRSDYWDGDIPWLSVKDFVGRIRNVWDTEKRITELGLSESATNLLNVGDVVISARGTVGEVARVGVPMAFNQSCYGLRARPNYVDQEFLFYLTRNVAAQLRKFGHGSVFDTITRQTFDKVNVLLPSIAEQQRIAALLGALDDKIESNQRIALISQQILQSLYESWFVKFEPWNGSMPTDWGVGQLSDILISVKESVKSGELPHLPYVPIDSIPMNRLGLDSFRPNSEAKSSLIKFERNDILVGAMRVYFHRVAISPFEGITRTTTFVLRPRKKHQLAYALLHVNAHESIKFANSRSKGSTMPYAVWDGGLAELPTFRPTDEILNHFETLVSPLISRNRDLLFETNKLLEIRDTLLPALLSGRIRVKKAESLVGEAL